MNNLPTLLITAGLLLGAAASLRAQDEPAKPAAAAAAKPAATPEAREEALKTLLQNVTFDGRWIPIDDGALGDERADKYQVVKAEKTPQGWAISAKMEYGDKSFEIPIPVKVEWAGDAAILIVDNLPMPGGQKYSARVMLYGNTYAGSWSGGDKAGLLSGIIKKN